MRKLLGIFGGAGTAAGAAGAFGACHVICQGAIAALAAVGITVAGMPLLFLQKPVFYVPFLSVGVAALGLSTFLWLKSKRCRTPAQSLNKPVAAPRGRGRGISR